MPTRIPVQTVIVHRDGKNIAAPIGKPFSFTDTELSDINKVNPGAVRHVVNEAPVEAEVVKIAAKTEGKYASAKSPAKGETAKSDAAGEL